MLEQFLQDRLVLHVVRQSHPQLRVGLHGSPDVRVVHLDVEDCSEELLRQQSYSIKNQRGASPY